MFKNRLFLISILTFVLFVFLSFSVAKESWTQIDFNITVKLQDRITNRFDPLLSLFSLLGSAEVTVLIALGLASIKLLAKKIWSFFGWLVIFPISLIEIIGKLVLFHPGPPALFHKTVVEAKLPSFYIHTNFSYPSGHTTRTLFIVTVLFIVIYFSKRSRYFKVISSAALSLVAFLTILTRVYLGEHWLSDCLGGLLLGVSGAFFATYLMRKDSKLPSD